MKVEAGLEERCKQLAGLHRGSVFDLIGTQFLELGTKKVVVSFSLNQTTQQVFGLMHGGIYPYIAESIASLGGWLGIDLDKQICVGIEVNANHVKGVSKLGETITGTAIALHPGRTIQVWQVEFRDSTGDLVSVSRCTLMIREKKA